MLVSSRPSWTTVFRPSSSSMMSFIDPHPGRARACRLGVPVRILEQVGAWTEEASRPLLAEDAALRPGGAAEALSVAGVPWLTLLFLLGCSWVLLASGAAWAGLSVSGLLAYGAKATPLILDRGETWRLLSANLLHKDLLHFAFNAFAIWNV